MGTHFETYHQLEQYLRLPFRKRIRNYLAESEILKIKTSWVDDPIIDLRTINHPFVLAVDLKDFRIRLGFFKRLLKVAKRLEKRGYKIKIFEIYRPLYKQRKSFDQIMAQMKKKFPKLSKEKLWHKTTEFIADPELCPPHSTGGAIDLTLVNSLTGKNVDMGTKVNAIDEKAALFCENLSAKAWANREVLFQTMLKFKIAPMCSEWWHYSYGECYWAAVFKKPRIYQSLDL